MDFNYTDSFFPDSELVDSVFYNNNKKEMVVGLDNDESIVTYYRYENVPPHVYQNFKTASSKGSFFNLTVKREYGPSVEVDDHLYDCAVPNSVVPFDVAGTSKVVNVTNLFNTGARTAENTTELEYTVNWQLDGRSFDYNTKALNDHNAVNALLDALAALGLESAEVTAVTRKDFSNL